jgi:hypothetical protein
LSCRLDLAVASEAVAREREPVERSVHLSAPWSPSNETTAATIRAVLKGLDEALHSSGRAGIGSASQRQRSTFTKEGTTWFIAREDEAKALEAIVTTEERSPEEWTYIELPLIQIELMALSAALRGSEDITSERTLENPLIYRGAYGLLIARVKDSLIQNLARVTDENVPGLAADWAELIDRKYHEPGTLHDLLTDLVKFSREAVARRSPVMTLTIF